MTRTNTLIREAKTEDIEFLWKALAIAAYESDVAVAKTIPVVRLHLSGWRRDCDFGCIAFHDNGTFLGAAWARQFSPDENPTYFHNDVTPEVSVGVVDHARGRGIGGALLAHLIEIADARAQGLCLNVRDDNRAIQLYQRCGFNVVEGAELVNRTGGRSLGMLRNHKAR